MDEKLRLQDRLAGKEGTKKDRGMGVTFSRIRRITGYLVGDMSTWGAAKLAEEKDRVKHT